MSTDASHPDDVGLCHQIMDEQQATITGLQQRMQRLEHYVEQLLRSKYGPRSERVDPHQLQLFDAAATTADVSTSNADETDAVVVKEHRRRGGGRNALPDHLPREVVEHDLSDKERCCPGCGAPRQRIGCETSEQLEFVPAVLKVIEHIRWKYACRSCQEHVAVAPPADKPLEKGLPGPGLLSAIVVGKYADHLPLYRLEDVFARAGVELSRSTLCRWALQTAELLEPLYRLLIERVRSSAVIHTDDTPVPVLDPALPQTRTARLWVYCGDWQNPYTVYDYTISRRRDGPAEFLQEFAGYLQADAFAGYDGIYAGGQVQQVLCWAHARRKFFEARTVQPEPAHRALAYIGRLYGVERAAQDMADRTPQNTEQAWRDWHVRRLELRQSQSRSVLAEFHTWLQEAQWQVLPKSPVGRAIGYVLPRWDGLTRYCEDGALAIDNNLSERMVRPVAIGRKNFLFMGSDNGGKAAAILYSVLASAKVNQVEPYAYVRDLLVQFSGEPPTDLSGLLPDHWLQAHPEARRRWSR
jgi:transposase